jgi:hypothetical protein
MASAPQRASEKERTPNLEKSDSPEENTVRGELIIMVYTLMFMSMKNTKPRGGKVQYIYRKKGLHLKSTDNDIMRKKSVEY